MATQEASNANRPYEAALVMLSNFGLRDGGRETWAYNFIPRLLEHDKELRLRVYGLRIDGEADNSTRLAAAVADRNRDRLSTTFFRAKANAIPNAFYYWRGLRRLLSGEARPQPAYVLAVGSFFEMAAVLMGGAFRRSAKIFWLRTIFVDEKAHRISGPLRSFARSLEDWAVRRGDLLIANGDDTAAYYRERGFDVDVIRNAVDFGRWKMSCAYPVTPPLRIAYVGRLARHKGIREFLQLAASFGGSEDVEFHVIGEGPEKPNVEQAQSRSPVIYHGAVPNDELPMMLGTFDACVALSFKSADGGTGGVSNALLEQMAAGRIILAWRSEIFEQVLDDESAYLLEQGSVEQLRRAILSIIEDPESARSRAEAAQRIARDYSFEAHMKTFESLLKAHGIGAGARWT